MVSNREGSRHENYGAQCLTLLYSVCFKVFKNSSRKLDLSDLIYDRKFYVLQLLHRLSIILSHEEVISGTENIFQFSILNLYLFNFSLLIFIFCVIPVN